MTTDVLALLGGGCKGGAIARPFFWFADGLSARAIPGNADRSLGPVLRNVACYQHGSKFPDPLHKHFFATTIRPLLMRLQHKPLHLPNPMMPSDGARLGHHPGRRHRRWLDYQPQRCSKWRATGLPSPPNCPRRVRICQVIQLTACLAASHAAFRDPKLWPE